MPLHIAAPVPAEIRGTGGPAVQVRQFFGDDARAVSEWEMINEDLGLALSSLLLCENMEMVAEGYAGVGLAGEEMTKDAALATIGVSLWTTSMLFFHRAFATGVRTQRLVADDIFSEDQLVYYRKTKAIRDKSIAHLADLRGPDDGSDSEPAGRMPDADVLTEVVALLRHALASARVALLDALEEFDWNREVHEREDNGVAMGGAFVLPNPDYSLAGERRPHWGSRPLPAAGAPAGPQPSPRSEGEGFPNRRTSWRMPGDSVAQIERCRVLSVCEDQGGAMVRIRGAEPERADANPAQIAQLRTALDTRAVFATVAVKEARKRRIKITEIF